MLKYIIKRLIVMIPIILILSFTQFAVANATGDPVTAYLNSAKGRGDAREATPEEIAQAKKALGLDQPMVVRYAKWGVRVLQGDLGYTMQGKKIIDEIAVRLPVSISLGVSGIICGPVLGVMLGVACARRQYSAFDYIVGIINYLVQSLPSLLTAILLVILFCQKLHWLPAFGYNSPDLVNPTWGETFLDHAKHMIIPIMCTALPGIGSYARFQRAAYLEVMRSDYVRTARSKGLSERKVAYRHALRNALLPMANISGGILMGIFGGNYIIETMFSLPGIGSLTTGALLAFDYNLMLSTNLISIVMGTVALLISDIVCAIVDPRIRYE